VRILALRDGTADGPTLLPLFRSEAQAKVLASLLLVAPEQTIAEIANKTGVKAGVVKREIDVLEDCGVVSSRYQGSNRLVRVDIKIREGKKSTYDLITDLVIATYGAEEVISEELAKIPGIQSAYVHGPWAERYFGIAGSVPESIDVVVIGEVSYIDLYDAELNSTERIQKPVNIRALRPVVLKGDEGPSLKKILEGPIVPIRFGGKVS
jgi:DNA-binding MarR family transcriptional regulator